MDESKVFKPDAEYLKYYFDPSTYKGNFHKRDREPFEAEQDDIKFYSQYRKSNPLVDTYLQNLETNKKCKKKSCSVVQNGQEFTSTYFAKQPAAESTKKINSLTASFGEFSLWSPPRPTNVFVFSAAKPKTIFDIPPIGRPVFESASENDLKFDACGFAQNTTTYPRSNIENITNPFTCAPAHATFTPHVPHTPHAPHAPHTPHATFAKNQYSMPPRTANIGPAANAAKTNPTIPQKNGRKKAIPATIRKLVWIRYIGKAIGEARCFCCRQTKIMQISFHCGHVVPESAGGKTSVENLRPICQNCNSSMGTQNMIEFMLKHGLDSLHISANA